MLERKQMQQMIRNDIQKKATWAVMENTDQVCDVNDGTESKKLCIYVFSPCKYWSYDYGLKGLTLVGILNYGRLVAKTHTPTPQLQLCCCTTWTAKIHAVTLPINIKYCSCVAQQKMKTCQHHVARWHSGMDADLVRWEIWFLKELNLLLCSLPTSKTSISLTIGGSQFCVDCVKEIR